MGNITAIHDQYYKYDEGGEYVSSSRLDKYFFLLLTILYEEVL